MHHQMQPLFAIRNMTIEEAIAIIRNPQSSFEDCIKAADCFVVSKETPLIYLVECLKRKGLCAEIAATNLYARTKRPRPDKTIHGICFDPEGWTNYLKQMNLN